MRLAGVIAAIALVGSLPAAAQQAEAPATAFTPDEDLDCAIYIGAIMAETAAEMTPESRVALTSAWTYFVGRYEAQSGRPVAQALVERFRTINDRDTAEIEQTCSIRARGFAARMQDAAKLMAEAQPAESSGSGSEAAPGE